ncbi:MULTISPECIES: hypothetical protein [Pseudomonas]|jgi:nucleoside phosphorylase|uniref:Nucleoside phosphorylase n=2 Tax=Pseudomonas rhodesiae TaxID=76760 RepID=A0AAE8HA24_9PSED|nr:MULTISPECIES: hypothetical protein [Pseudomonas]MBJ2220956.1 hypothetical protein [Pseudomonas sp. MF7453]TWR56270.1 hypothetical protein FIV35_07020 [Pseudomonas rhodesiae]SDU96423.1 Nucleoside phosphorylase [Pseudomonas rhodesiae]
MQLSLELRNHTILFVTSNDIERDALISALNICGVKMQRKAIGLLQRLRVGVLAGYPVCLLSAERGSHGKASVGMLLPEVLQTLCPRLVVLSGFCYGNSAVGDLHDVAISNKIVSLIDFVAKEGSLKLRSQPVLSSRIDDEQLSRIVGAVTPRFNQSVKALGISSKIVTGTVYSGEVFSEDESFASTLFGADSSAVGGDMEGQPVAAQCNQREIPWIFAKSPSDKGGGTAGTKNAQVYSAKIAAIAACHLAQEFISTEGLSVSKVLSEYIGENGDDPMLDILDDASVHQLMGNRTYAEKIGGFVNKCSLGVSYDAGFRSHLIAVLKEMVENSVKWGQSSRIQLRGGAQEITLDSDGRVFNPLTEFQKMKVSGGGQRDLASFLSAYGPSGSGIVDVNWYAEDGSQSLVFRLKELSCELRQSYFCTLMLTAEDLRGYAFSYMPLGDLSNCREVWLDAKDLFLSGSDGMLLSNLCAKIPKSVERIYIRWINPRYAHEFKEHFAFDARVVFVEGMTN